jgi:hypothetical protein
VASSGGSPPARGPRAQPARGKRRPARDERALVAPPAAHAPRRRRPRPARPPPPPGARFPPAALRFGDRDGGELKARGC